MKIWGIIINICKCGSSSSSTKDNNVKHYDTAEVHTDKKRHLWGTLILTRAFTIPLCLFEATQQPQIPQNTYHPQPLKHSNTQTHTHEMA